MRISNFPEKTFKEHVADLRKFAIISIVSYFVIFGACFYFASNIYQILAKSLQVNLAKYSLKGDFIVTSVTEVFSTYLGLSFYVSLILFLPVFLIYIYIYLLPVLSKKEKKISFVLLFLIPILFFLGAGFTYFVAFGVVWDFFIQISHKSNIVLLPKVSEYISLSLSMMLAFGLACELPVFLIILSLFNLIDEKSILKFGKYAVVLAFVLGAILTPPDPISQIIVAIILIVLYYLSYFVVKIISKIPE
jgi:sec-independent protein translocase protein TatC